MLWHTHSSSYFTPTSIVHLTKKGDRMPWWRVVKVEKKESFMSKEEITFTLQVRMSLDRLPLRCLISCVRPLRMTVLNKNNAEHHHASVYNQTIPDPPFPDAGMTYVPFNKYVLLLSVTRPFLFIMAIQRSFELWLFKKYKCRTVPLNFHKALETYAPNLAPFC